MRIKKIKKLLYLLQLEEYEQKRYSAWLKKYSVFSLKEKKNKLRWTTRIIITFTLSLLFSLPLKEEKAVEIANAVLSLPFKFIEKLIIQIAACKLNLLRPSAKIVITGSYGKTTFKEMLAWVLETKYPIFKTKGNINTAIGIAQEIIKNLNKKHKVMVIEAGAYKKGEIKEICKFIKPSFGIVTVIGLMHLERFGNVENIRSAKLEIAEYIKDKNKLFYPSKDHQFIDIKETIEKIAKILSIPPNTVKERISSFSMPDHRLTIQKINKKVVLIDDSYNSNPLGFLKALDTLKGYALYQKIVVTPGMIELGNKQSEQNEKAAFETAKVADVFVVVGETNKKALLVGAQKNKKKKGKIIFMDKNEKLEDIIRPVLHPPTVILLENDLPDHYF